MLHESSVLANNTMPQILILHDLWHIYYPCPFSPDFYPAKYSFPLSPQFTVSAPTLFSQLLPSVSHAPPHTPPPPGPQSDSSAPTLSSPPPSPPPGYASPETASADSYPLGIFPSFCDSSKINCSPQCRCTILILFTFFFPLYPVCLYRVVSS